MDEAQTLTHMNDAGRERIRRTLRRYMEEQRIGAPALQVRIIEADKPRHREIPLSTLQRFLLGSHRTQEHHVALCHDFAKALPYFGEDYEAGLVGQALFAFLNAQGGGDDKEVPAQQITRVAGRYEYRSFAIDGLLRELPFPPQKDAAGTLTLHPAAQTPYLYAREFLDDRAFSQDSPARRYAYEGAMVLVAPHAYVLLRDCLTRVPKMYALCRRDVADEGDVVVFEGSGLESHFLGENPLDGDLHQRRRLQFVLTAPGGE